MSSAELTLPDAAKQITVIRPGTGWVGLELNSLWAYRELLFFLLWRDVKVRYKQTMLGAAWVVLQPVLTVMLFAVIFGSFAKLPSDNVPYIVYAYCALLPWSLLSAAVTRSGTSLVASANLISKVYFPRLLVPISAALGGLVDFAISFCVLLVILLAHGRLPGPGIILLPLLALGVLLLGLAVGLVLSALNVRYRDVSYAQAFLLQIWMYASPVAYSASVVPQKWVWLYRLNPMVGYIQAFRWCLVGETGTMGVPWVASVVGSLVLITGALIYFRQVERGFADAI